MFKSITKGAVALALVLVAPLSVFAASSALPAGCNIPPDHAIWNIDNTAVTGCISAANWNAAMTAQQHGVNLPVFVYPATVTDKYGITYACEQFLVHGCVDATKTPEYDAYIQGLGLELVQQGYNVGDFGGRFDGVMRFVGTSRL